MKRRNSRLKGFGPFTDKIRNFRRVRLTKS
ncbi:hypothetical protein EV657_12359 [Rhodovulum visakhapatnamense]|uniref:Uncharacterized protein n=1 Tax=Rhodovulum visakhapatnamense TaxID=364297 RepID=A0A4R8FPQ3_9RHOB|nr:hypothetical protein EV657_12359 [Rhodovulum visakhapatnamense]